RAAGEPARRCLHDLELGDGGLAQALDLFEPLARRRDHLGERAELRNELLGERLHVALRDGAKQDQLEELVVADRLAAGGEEALPQPRAMAVIVPAAHAVAGRAHRSNPAPSRRWRGAIEAFSE